jgi:hypothetical protein
MSIARRVRKAVWAAITRLAVPPQVRTLSPQPAIYCLVAGSSRARDAFTRRAPAPTRDGTKAESQLAAPPTMAR